LVREQVSFSCCVLACSIRFFSELRKPRFVAEMLIAPGAAFWHDAMRFAFYSYIRAPHAEFSVIGDRHTDPFAGVFRLVLSESDSLPACSSSSPCDREAAGSVGPFVHNAGTGKRASNLRPS